MNICMDAQNECDVLRKFQLSNGEWYFTRNDEELVEVIKQKLGDEIADQFYIVDTYKDGVPVYRLRTRITCPGECDALYQTQENHERTINDAIEMLEKYLRQQAKGKPSKNPVTIYDVIDRLRGKEQ